MISAIMPFFSGDEYKKDMPDTILRWALPAVPTVEEAEKLMLVKFGVMKSGTLKDGRHMEPDNVIFGMGGMRRAAANGEAEINIDHIHDELPESYTKKYGLEEGTIGLIVDTQYHRDEEGNVIGQAFGFVENPKIYKMIKEGKFNGCSVEDYNRHMVCSKEYCDIRGSSYKDNALMLDEIPNSHGTWVEVVGKDDLGTLIQAADSDNHASSNLIQKITEHMKHCSCEKVSPAEPPKFNKKPAHNIESYMNNGDWINGFDSVKEFLAKEHDIHDEKIARAIHVGRHKMETLAWQDTDGIHRIYREALINSIGEMGRELIAHSASREISKDDWTKLFGQHSEAEGNPAELGGEKPAEGDPVDTPAEDTPTEEASVEDTPTEDVPVDTPAEEAPTEEENPIENKKAELEGELNKLLGKQKAMTNNLENFNREEMRAINTLVAEKKAQLNAFP